mgnify:FL=1
MELRNPSVSKIRSGVEFISDCVGTVVGRDFETNQPVFYETKVLRDNPKARDYLDKKLGEEIQEPGNSPVLRATWLGSPDVYDNIDASSGRFVGVTRQ